MRARTRLLGLLMSALLVFYTTGAPIAYAGPDLQEGMVTAVKVLVVVQDFEVEEDGPEVS